MSQTPSWQNPASRRPCLTSRSLAALHPTFQACSPCAEPPHPHPTPIYCSLTSLDNCGFSTDAAGEQGCVNTVYGWWQDAEHPCSKAGPTSCSDDCKAALEEVGITQACYTDVLALLPVAGAVEL